MALTVNTTPPAVRVEPRWPVALVVLAAAGLLSVLPERIKAFPSWSPYLMGASLFVPVVAVWWTRGSGRWLRAERAVTLLFFALTLVGTLVNLGEVFATMALTPARAGGTQLFASSVSMWIANVMAFSLLYWQLDRGGPEARLNGGGARPDWVFPQQAASEEAVASGWQPAFVDYLFLGYATATAFSTTDVVPFTARAKLLMMLESTISLFTIVVIAARAINILGS